MLVTARELLRQACTSQSPPLSSEFYETYCSSPSKKTFDTVRVRAPRQARYRPDRRSATQFEGPQHVSGSLDRWAALGFCVPKSPPLGIASRPHGQSWIRVVPLVELVGPRRSFSRSAEPGLHTDPPASLSDSFVHCRETLVRVPVRSWLP